MGLLFLYLALAILVSFLCSILEAVLLSISPAYIESISQQGKKHGKLLAKLKQNIDRPLAAILSLNTIAHTIGAAGVGAQATFVFGEAYVGIISAILTLLILVFSEIIPKTIGANYWKNLASFTAKSLKILIIVMYPLVLLSQGLTKLLSAKDKQPRISREEISAMADIGMEEGVFAENESRILKNLIMMKKIQVQHIMTPRPVIVAASESLTVQKLYENKEILRFSRIPIYHNKIDEVTGYVHKHDLLDKLASDQHELLLKEIKREIMIIPEKISLPALFEKFMEMREHVALAVDEYGSVSGLVTMEDVVETLLGMEIMDEFDNIEDMQQLARQRWQERAKQLKIIPEDKGATDKDIVKYSITGNKPPKD